MVEMISFDAIKETLSIRQPEVNSHGFSHTVVDRFFDNLEEHEF